MNKKKIEKARICRCYNSITDEVEYQLQFKMEGDSQYKGFSIDTFTKKGAKDALFNHLSGGVQYVPYATNGDYVLCKVNI